MDIDDKYKIPQHVKNYLTSGKHYNLYKENGDKKVMHIFLTPDLQEILAVRPGTKQIKNQWRIQMHQIRNINMYTEGQEAQFKKTGCGKYKNLIRKAPKMELCMVIEGPTTL